jgi:3-oxoacyl-[acyl-carrier-protein] synthase-3
MPRLAAIEGFLPEKILSNGELSLLFPEWDAEKILDKTGFSSRHVSSDSEFSSDLGAQALRALMDKHRLSDDYFDYLIVVCQTPDFLFPNVSSLIHRNLGLRSDIACVDISLGCSGYVYGLHFANLIVNSNPSLKVALVTSDTYTKLLNVEDRSVRTIFGDGATASLIQKNPLPDTPSIELSTESVFGSDGSGAGKLIVPNGQISNASESISPKAASVVRGLAQSEFDLYMDGPGIFSFAIERVPQLVDELAHKVNSDNKFDKYVFHQANKFMLDHLCKKMGLTESQAPFVAQETGNTVSSSIPLALINLIERGAIADGDSMAMVGFGVGLSWAGTSGVYFK